MTFRGCYKTTRPCLINAFAEVYSELIGLLNPVIYATTMTVE